MCGTDGKMNTDPKIPGANGKSHESPNTRRPQEIIGAFPFFAGLRRLLVSGVNLTLNVTLTITSLVLVHRWRGRGSG